MLANMYMKKFIYLFISLTLVGCNREDRFTNLEKIIFSDFLTYKFDTVDIKMSTNKIYDSLKLNIIPSPDIRVSIRC